MSIVGVIKDLEGNTYHIESDLGRGLQGATFLTKNSIDTRPLVVKLYHNAGSNIRPFETNRLKRIISVGKEIAPALPDFQICFPYAIIDDGKHFGTVMPLAVGQPLTDDTNPIASLLLHPNNQSANYTGQLVRQVADGRVCYRSLMLAALHLARGVNELHRHGMAHSDLALGNLFLDPESGRISVIDCDNLACDGLLPTRVGGTPGYRMSNFQRHQTQIDSR